MLDLKRALMELGNDLVSEGYGPGGNFTKRKEGVTHLDSKSTAAISIFTEWLNRHPLARDLLSKQGIEWPVVEAQKHG